MNQRIFLVIIFLMKKISAESEKPVFIKCSEYETTILEGLKVGTVVLEVAATVNNVDVVDIEYTLLSNNRFKIDVISGQITTNYVFDRDVPKNEKEEIIRVCATFKKDPKLKGFCDIKIVIDDVNDNLPTFQQNEFHKDLLINSKINEMIFKIEATDIDDEENSKIGYELYSDLLRVDNSGAIFLKNIVDKKPGEFYLVTLRAFNTNNPLNFTECYINFRVINENVFIPSITLPQSTESFTSSNVIIVDKNPSTLSQSTKSTNDQTTDKTTLLVNNINTEADKVKHDSNNGTQKDDITTSIRKKIIGYVMKDYNLIVICVITVIIIINLWVCCCCCRKTKRVSHDFISNDDSLYFNENDKRNYFEMVERTTNSYVSTTRKDIEFQEEPLYQECPIRPKRDYELYHNLNYYNNKNHQSSTPNESFYKTPTTFKKNHIVVPELHARPLVNVWTNNENQTPQRNSVPCYSNIEINVKK